MTSTAIFLLQTACIVVVPLGIFRALRMHGLVPLVVVQILIGIGLGPSVFEPLFPMLYQSLFNATTLAPLSGIAAIGVLIFGFITGVHLDTRTFKGRGRAFAFLAVCSIGIPGLMGYFVGLWIAVHYPVEVSSNVSPAEFAAAISICTSVIAMPVLAAILREMNLLGHRVGQLALGIAAINDACLWVFLGVLLAAVAGQRREGLGVFAALILLPVHFLAMTALVKRVLTRWQDQLAPDNHLREGGLVLVCAIALGSAAITEAMGLHYLIGAFIAGVSMPEKLRQPILDRIQIMTVTLLLPFFFTLTGLRTKIDFTSPSFLHIFFVATSAAMFGKIFSTALAAKASGENWPFSFGLGALMQTKGLVEVIVLTILSENGIVSDNVFSALILMAVVTTSIAMPLAKLSLGRQREVSKSRSSAMPLQLS